tara:strand:+ start:777 stop:1178 length:402 start_codon:yes stop_codon:yes gene_type:complete
MQTQYKETYEAILEFKNKMKDLMIDCVDKETEVEFIKDLADKLSQHDSTYQISYSVNNEMSNLKHEIYKIKEKLVDLEEIFIHRFDFGFLDSYEMIKLRRDRIKSNLDCINYITQDEGNHIYGQLWKFESNYK